MSAEIEILDEKTIKELLEKASPSEKKYILELEQYHRQGEAFVDYNNFEVIHGEAKVVEKECWDEGYPYRRGCSYFIIPLTVPVVIREWWYDNTSSPTNGGEKIYVFTREGWKEVRVQ